MNYERKSLMKSDDFYFEIVFYKDVAKSKEYVKEIYNKFLKKYGYSKNDITWKLTSKGIGFSSSSENIGFDLEDYILDNMYKYGDYKFETDYKLMESKKSTRKSIKESYEIPTNKNANWYTARFTDITIFKNKVILENYYTDEKYSIEDKKFAEKISFYLYSDEKNGIFHWYEMGNEVEKWMNNRKFSKIYDNLENRK